MTNPLMQPLQGIRLLGIHHVRMVLLLWTMRNHQASLLQGIRLLGIHRIRVALLHWFHHVRMLRLMQYLLTHQLQFRGINYQPRGNITNSLTHSRTHAYLLTHSPSKQEGEVRGRLNSHVKAKAGSSISINKVRNSMMAEETDAPELHIIPDNRGAATTTSPSRKAASELGPDQYICGNCGILNDAALRPESAVACYDCAFRKGAKRSTIHEDRMNRR